MRTCTHPHVHNIPSSATASLRDWLRDWFTVIPSFHPCTRTQVVLELNYRSTPRILSVGQFVLQVGGPEAVRAGGARRVRVRVRYVRRGRGLGNQHHASLHRQTSALSRLSPSKPNPKAHHPNPLRHSRRRAARRRPRPRRCAPPSPTRGTRWVRPAMTGCGGMWRCVLALRGWVAASACVPPGGWDAGMM